MWLCARETRAQFALFSGLCAAHRATNRQGRFLFGFHGLHNERLLPNKMVKSDQSITPLLLNNCSREIPTSAGFVLWLLAIGPYFVCPFSSTYGHNVATELLSTEGPFGSCRVALADPGGSDTNSRPIAVEGISAESNRGDRKLSSAALWNRHFHHRPLQRHFCGVRDCSTIGASGRRYRRRI